MEQEFINCLLHPSAGMSVGAQFSSEDVSHIYGKVFHVTSNTDEAQTAMTKIAGGDKNWACVGENVLDVLLEMERERERKEQLYWELQLQNVGNLNPLYARDPPVITDPHVQSCLDKIKNPENFNNAYHQSDSGISQSYRKDTGRSQTERRVRRLRRAARQCWARLVSEGVHSILPSSCQGISVGVEGGALGCVSLSDVLLLLEVKYDVVTHLLHKEMLEEHHTQCVWETFLPWQRHKEHEGLEDLAEEGLVSGDMLDLAQLPGAFRVYRSRLESRPKSWSAISLLCELRTSCQQERDTLTVLGKWMDRDSMRLLCLYIRLGTLRAQRERLSYNAYLEARQSWETWPHVSSPCKAEQAVLWLQGEEEEHEEDVTSLSPEEQSVLRLLVLTQEQERRYLVKLVHGVSLEDLQVTDCAVPLQEESKIQSALRNGYMKAMLGRIHVGLQTRKETPLEQANPRTQCQSKPQPQMQAQVFSKPAVWSQHQLEDCALLLLSHLLELQEVQASAILSELMNKSAQHLHILQDKYKCEVQAPSYANLLQLLMSDDPLSSDSVFAPWENVTKDSSTEQMTQSSCTASREALNSSVGPGNALTGSVRGQAAESTGQQEVCTGCGAVMEELPYLEISCVSDKSKTHQEITAEQGAQETGEGCTMSYEKQGSLITLAWSKPPHDDAHYDAECADGGTEQNQGHHQRSVRIQANSCRISSTSEHTGCDEASGKSHNKESGSNGHHNTQPAIQQCNTKAKLSLEERHMIDQPRTGGAISECDLQTHALVAETLQELQPYANDYCCALASEKTDASEDRVELQTSPTAIESEPLPLRGLESPHPDDQKCNLKAKAECDFAEGEAMREPTLTERERVREPVSAMERERTMRNLVDMQRKVEQKQQRDRERQLLRVQERLSIIQNRKAEEDLLGLKHTDRLKHLTQDLPQDDKNQQKTVVRERLEQLRRERSYMMQSKRDRNTAGFKELLCPVTLHCSDTEDG